MIALAIACVFEMEDVGVDALLAGVDNNDDSGDASNSDDDSDQDSLAGDDDVELSVDGQSCPELIASLSKDDATYQEQLALHMNDADAVTDLTSRFCAYRKFDRR